MFRCKHRHKANNFIVLVWRLGVGYSLGSSTGGIGLGNV